MVSLNDNYVNTSQELALRFANPSITQSPNFEVRYFAKKETKQKAAVTRTRAVKSILEPKTQFCCPIENCKKVFFIENNYARHVSSEHKKSAEKYPARILKVTKTEVGRNTAIQDSLNNTAENAKKVKTPFRNTKPKPRSSCEPYQRPPSKTPSKIRTRDGHNEFISKQKTIAIQNDSVQHEIINSCATAYEMVQLGCRDDFFVKMGKLFSKSHAIRYESITPNVFRQNIMSMSNEVESQLLRRVMKSRYYALQIAESAEVANFNMLLVFVRYKYDSTIQESLLLSHHISPTMDGTIIFHIIDKYINRNKLEWDNCTGINIATSQSRLQEIKNCAPKRTRFTNNFSDRVAFLQNNISASLREELQQMINLVNDNKMDALRWSRHPMKDNKFERIYLHTRDLWLGYTDTLSLVLEKPEKFGLKTSKEMYQLACLTDLFKFFNSAANEIYRQKSESIFWINDRINALIRTTKLYQRECEQSKFEVFPNVEFFAAPHDPDIDYDVLSRSLNHLANKLYKYRLLSDNEKIRYEWIRDPFHLTIGELYADDFSIHEKTILIMLATDSKMETEFMFNTLEDFWIIASRAGYSEVAERALRFLLNFKNSYLLESCFAAFVDIRGDHLTDFMSENAYLRLKMSSIKPNLN